MRHSASDARLKLHTADQAMSNAKYANATHSARYFKARGSPKASAHRGCIDQVHQCCDNSSVKQIMA
jgi:hypothetical protein